MTKKVCDLFGLVINVLGETCFKHSPNSVGLNLGVLDFYFLVFPFIARLAAPSIDS